MRTSLLATLVAVASGYSVGNKQDRMGVENLILPGGFLAVTINKGDIKKVSVLPVHANGRAAGNATALVEGFANPAGIDYLPRFHALVIADPGKDTVFVQKLNFDANNGLVANGGPIPILSGHKIFSVSVARSTGDVYLGDKERGGVLMMPHHTIEMIVNHPSELPRMQLKTQIDLREASQNPQEETAKPEVFELYSADSSAALNRGTAPIVASELQNDEVMVGTPDTILRAQVDVVKPAVVDLARQPAAKGIADTQNYMYYTAGPFIKAFAHGRGSVEPEVVTDTALDANGIAWDQMNTLYYVDTLSPGAMETTGAVFTFPCESFQNGDMTTPPEKVYELDGSYDVAYVPAEPVHNDKSLLQVMEDVVEGSWFWPM